MKRTIAVILLAGVLAACSGSDSPTGVGASGSMAFGYAGTVSGSGSFSASGTVNQTNPSTTQAWAAGWVEQGTFYASATRPQANARFDMAVISINRTTAGTMAIDASCDPDTDAACTGFAVIFNLSQTSGAGMIICGLTTGNVTVSSISGSRATGTFSGSGICVNLDTSAESSFNVSNGTFDVAVITVPAG